VSSAVTAKNDATAGTPAPTADGSAVERPTERRAVPQVSPNPQQQGQLRQQSQLFRDLMAGRMTAWQMAELAARGDATALTAPAVQAPDQQSGFADDLRQNADVAALMATERRIDAGPAVQNVAPPPASPDRAFAELIEKHVRRVLASREARGSHGGEVRIELSDAVLPGTALLLRRTASGWRLSAASDNRQSLEKLEQFAPALVERFARASLGRLEFSLEHAPDR
jgi:hypothetical protein